MFGDPVLNEKGWNLTSLESVCQSIYGGGTPSKKIKEYYMGSYSMGYLKGYEKRYYS